MSVKSPRLPAHPDRKIWLLTWPILLANLSTPLLGLVDTALLGHADSATALAAAAVGASIYSYVFWGFGFLRQGATGLTAQAFGAKQNDQQQKLLSQTVITGFGIGCLLMFCSAILVPAALALMQIEGELASQAAEYLYIRSYAAPFMLAGFGMVGWMIGRQRSTDVMLVMVTGNLLNIALDYWFIYQLGWGSRGAAIASSLAEFSGFLLACLLVFRQGFFPVSLKVGFSHWKALLQQNHYLFQRSLLLLLCFSLFTAQGAHFGTNVLAANTILFQLLLFCSYFLDAYAHTIETLAGEASGKNEKSLLLFWIKKVAIWNLITAILICIAFWLGKDIIASVFSSNPEINQQVSLYFYWLLSLPLIAAGCYFLDGVFIGLARAREMRNSMLLSFLLYLLAWFLLGRGNNHGLWFAMVFLHLARLATMTAFYRKIKAALVNEASCYSQGQ